ncbi:MAG: hypothetical protein H6861_07245 [Rhodospirillales bacterium]|nr:hypothetical protein [Rhodospirillales bacterium]
MTRLLLILLLIALCPAPLWAADSCIKPASVMLLQSEDEKRLERARALKAYLKAQGQNTQLASAIYKASLKTGVDFELMVLKAKMESDLGRLTVSAHSSARGSFQYIEPTWLTLMRRYGEEAGYPHYAAAIERPNFPGPPRLKTKNPYLKAEILALRHDPETSALIKAYQIREETAVIQSYKGGGKVTATDHYIAHMLGLSLAKEFYRMKNRGLIIAVAKLNNPAMREAAKLNRAFFYDGKRPLTAREAYGRFERKVQKEFAGIQTVAAQNKTPACMDAGPTPALAKLEELTPLCSGSRAEPQQPFSLHAALHPWHPCARVRTH